MVLSLLSLQLKEARRSSVFQKNIAVNIILGFFIIYFGLCFVALGYFADRILLKTYPGQSAITSFNSLLLYYFLADLFVRFLLQELPVLAIQPYLHLNIRKNRLIHFVLLKSVSSMFNLLMLLVFVPFMLRVVVPEYGMGVALLWLLSLQLLTFFNNFLLIYFKRQLSGKPLLTLIFGLVLVALMLLDYLDLLSLRQVSALLFGYLLQQPWLVVVPALLLALAYSLNYSFLKAHAYIEEISSRKVKAVEGGDIKFLNRFGETGRLIALELKLIWRHKRSKSVVMMSLMFFLYGFIFYPNKMYQEGFMMLIFVGIIITGMFMFNYGQFVPSWQSGHFDALLTKRISPYQFYQAKFWMFVPVSVLSFLLTLPYGFFGYKIILINLAALLFNIGVNVFVVFYFSVLNKNRIDLSKSSAFNWQGVGASKFVMQLPLFLLPILIYLPFGLLDVPYWGIFTMGLLGLLGFVFHRQFLQLAANRFIAHKYDIAAGFRQA